MIELQLDARTVGNTVFAFSPLAELAASLCQLARRVGNPVHGRWVSEVRDRLDHPQTDVLFALLGGDARWVPDFLFPAVPAPRQTIEDQLLVVARLDADQLVADLLQPWPDRGWPRSMDELLSHGSGAGAALARALHDYWTVAVQPYWANILPVLEDDVAFRASHLLSSGIFGAFDDLPLTIDVSEERLRIDHPGPDHLYEDASFVLVPSVFAYPGCVVTHDVPGVFQITYGARGAARLWEQVHRLASPGPAALEALLGANRARILRSLAVPSSTTQLAADLQQPPSVVSRHLRILHASGLAVRHRSGRSVLYQQSPLATSLVEVNEIGG